MSGSQANRKKVLESIRTTLGANAPDKWREANVRHRLVTDIVDAYGRWDAEQDARGDVRRGAGGAGKRGRR